MIRRSDIHDISDNSYCKYGIVDDVNSAIQMIFDAFEITPLHEEAVRMAKERAAISFTGEQRDRALLAIEQLGRMMDRKYRQKKGRLTS